MPKTSTHTVLFGVRLSLQERDQLRKFAREHKRSASEVARVLMRVGAVYAKPSDFGIDLTDIAEPSFIDELTQDLQDIYDACAGEKHGPAYDASMSARYALERIVNWKKLETEKGKGE